MLHDAELLLRSADIPFKPKFKIRAQATGDSTASSRTLLSTAGARVYSFKVRPLFPATHPASFSRLCSSLAHVRDVTFCSNHARDRLAADVSTPRYTLSTVS